MNQYVFIKCYINLLNVKTQLQVAKVRVSKNL